MKLANATRAAMAQAFLDDIESGFVKVYNGTRPTNPDTALSGNTLLASIPLDSPAGSNTNGVITVDVSAAEDTSADASGTPTFCRIFKADGTTAVADISAGVGSGEANFEDIIVAGVVVPLTAATFTVPVGSA